MSTAPIREVPEMAYSLGELVEDFRVSRRDLRSGILGTAVVIAVCICLCPVVFYLKDSGLIAPVDTGDYLLIGTCVTFMLGFLCGGISIILQMHAKRHTRVLLFVDGLVSFKPEQVFSCRWDEIEWTREVFFPDCAVLAALIVHCRSGAEWILDRRTEVLGDSKRLAERIQTEAATTALPGVLDKLQSGELVSCGSVVLSFQGIMYRDKLLAWADVEAIEPHGFNVKIRGRGKWFVWATIAASELVNKHLLLGVAVTMKAEQQGTIAT